MAFLGFIISQGDRALVAGSWLGLRVLALQPWGPLSKYPLEAWQLSLRRGAGWEGPHSPHTLDPGGAPV